MKNGLIYFYLIQNYEKTKKPKNQKN